MNDSQIHQYLQNQINRAPSLLRAYAHNEQGDAYLFRNKYTVVKKIIEDFIKGQKEIRIVGIPGLRGVGKTTLLAQLFLEFLPRYPKRMLYISADRVVNEFNSDLFSIFKTYQSVLGTSYEELSDNIFIFIDEIHFDHKWASVLKSIYDRSKKVFVVCTGSSALSLQSTTDLARRVIFEKLYPLSFTEYILLKTKYKSLQDNLVPVKFPVKDLGNSISNALFYSESAKQCFMSLKEMESRVQEYWFGIDSLELDKYLKYGTMPYALTIKDEQRIHLLSGQQIDRVVEKDLPELGKFDAATIATVKNLLLLISGSCEVSVTKLASNLKNISVVTLMEVLETLEKAEMLIRVYPYGSTYKKVRKPSKYHFMTPALRHTLLETVEGEGAFENHKGKYLEDLVALTLYRKFSQKLTSPIFYDSAQEGADFILKLSNRKIALEVGYGTKESRQTKGTLEKIKGDYGLIVSKSELKLEEKTVKVPLNYFLLI